jgi:3-oxoacyl-[acyl-carrier protein] reductase
MRLKGKTALISGAGRNNGRAIALTFAREGADLVLIARSRSEELNKVAAECESYGVKTLALLGDVGDSAQARQLAKQGLEHFGKIDVLVCVAGLRPHPHFLDISDEQWHQIFAVNLHSTFYLSQAVIPGMIERGTGGSIIALGGVAALTAQKLGSAVVASKSGLHGLIKSLASEFGPHNIRANMLVLSFIDNVRSNPEWYKDIGGDFNTNREELESTPLRRTGKPQEVANVALFLASDESSYITGDHICCTGGRHL